MADAKATPKIDPLAVLPAAQDVMKQIAQREAEKASVALREIVGGIRPIKWLVEKGTIVIAADGGGIPTVGFLDWGRPTARAFRRANRKQCASTASPRDRWGGPKVDAARSAIGNKSLDREASLGHSARRRHDRRQGSHDNRIGLTNAKLTCHMPNQPAASASTPMSGNVMYLPVERVRPLEITMVQAMSIVKAIGVGSGALLRGVDLTSPTMAR